MGAGGVGEHRLEGEGGIAFREQRRGFGQQGHRGRGGGVEDVPGNERPVYVNIQVDLLPGEGGDRADGQVQQQGIQATAPEMLGAKGSVTFQPRPWSRATTGSLRCGCGPWGQQHLGDAVAQHCPR